MKNYFVYFSYISGGVVKYGAQIINVDSSTIDETVVNNAIRALELVNTDYDIIRFRLIE
jgi:hypothetical protein